MFKKQEIPQCPICFDELSKDLSVTKCGHVFHKQCIEQALRRNPQCPLDRVCNHVEQLRHLSYSIIQTDSPEADEFFHEIPDDQKKSIEKLSLKIKSLLGERHSLTLKCSGLENQREGLESEVADYKTQYDANQKLINDQKNQIFALNNKVQYKECIAEDVEREKGKLMQENNELKAKMEEFKNLHKVIKMMEKTQSEHQDALKGGRGILDSKSHHNQTSGVGASVKWATDIRKTHNTEQQANIFYESYRIILVKEDSYKSRIEDLKKENENLKSQNQSLEIDFSQMKKRCQALQDKNKKYKMTQESQDTEKKEPVSEKPSFLMSEENIVEQSERGIKKRKFNEFSEQVNPLDPKKRVLMESNESLNMQTDSKVIQKIPTQNPFSKEKLKQFSTNSFTSQKSKSPFGSFLSSNKSQFQDKLKAKKLMDQKGAAQAQQNKKQLGLGSYMHK